MEAVKGSYEAEDIFSFGKLEEVAFAAFFFLYPESGASSSLVSM